MTEPRPYQEKKRGWDRWLDPEWELLIGCVLLVVSGWWWFESRGGIWEGWKNILATATVFLGPYLVNRAWKRKREDEAALRAYLIDMYHWAREREGLNVTDPGRSDE